MTEFELKFLVPDGTLSALEQALALGTARRRRLQAAYLDTADRLLTRNRLSLRLRKEGRTWVQTLKAPGDSAVHRLEHNAPRPGAWGDPGPPLDISLHAGTPAGDALLALLHEEGGTAPPLQVIYRADVWRRTVIREHHGTRVEVALDQGRLLAGERQEDVSEVEFELVEGSPSAVVALAAEVALPHGLWLSTVSKAERGELLARGQRVADAAHARAPDFTGAERSGPALLRAALSACLDQVLANGSAVASGAGSEEHIHQLRVGLRRLRTALRELGGISAGVRAEWDAPLSQAFAALGEVRDRDTVGAAVALRLAAVGAPPVTLPAPDFPADAGATVRERGFQAVLLDILALASTADDAPAAVQPLTAAVDGALAKTALAPAPRPRRHVRKRLSRLYRQIADEAGRFEALDADSQHRVRKRLKRLRYLSELVAGLFERKAAEKFVEALRPAQEALGDYNDLLVARDLYRARAEQGDGAAWFAVGWLAAQVPAGAKACRKALEKACRARAFW